MALKQHPDLNKDSHRRGKASFFSQTYNIPVPVLKCERSLIMSSSVQCTPDVQALIPFSLKTREQKIFSLKCFVVVFFSLLLFFYHYDFTKGGEKEKRLPSRGQPPEGFISLPRWPCEVPMKRNQFVFVLCHHLNDAKHPSDHRKEICILLKDEVQ